jgi:hypothetical protein
MYYHELVTTLSGTPPKASLAEHYLQNIEDFQRDFTDIDLDRLDSTIGHFKVVVDSLKKIKHKGQKLAHRR